MREKEGKERGKFWRAAGDVEADERSIKNKRESEEGFFV